MLFHRTEKPCRGTLLSFRKFLESEYCMDKKVHGLPWFCFNFFCLSAKTFREATLYFVTFFRFRFFLLKRVRSQFFFENFLSHGAEYFRRETFLCFRKVPVLEKITDERGGEEHDFPSKLFFLTTKMFRTGTILCFRMFRVTKL